MEIIEITRGDTERISFNIKKKDGSDYVMQDNDKLYFTMKKDCRLGACCLQKTFNNGITHNQNAEKKYTVRLESEDTTPLEFSEYKFDIQIIWNNDNKYDTKTLYKGIIKITEEVTHNNNEV